MLSYVIDVYRGTVPPQRNLLQLATYVAMFPQLIAGPVSYTHLPLTRWTTNYRTSMPVWPSRRSI